MVQSKQRFVVDYTPIEIHPENAAAKKVNFPLIKTFLLDPTGRPVVFRGIVDSGADFCIFPFEMAERAGIDLKQGKSSGRTRGIGGTERIIFYEITVGLVLNNKYYEFETEVSFSKNIDFGFLGRRGFFDLFDEVSFRQDSGKFQLKGEGSRVLRKSSFDPEQWL